MSFTVLMELALRQMLRFHIVMGGFPNPLLTGYPPFIFQLIFGVRVYFDRGCRSALGLLEPHLFTLPAGRVATHLSELSCDVISSTCTMLRGQLFNWLCFAL